MTINWGFGFFSFKKDDGLERDKTLSTDAVGTHQTRTSSGSTAARTVVSGAATLVGPLAPGDYEIVAVDNAVKAGHAAGVKEGPDNMVWLQGDDASLAVAATTGHIWPAYDEPKLYVSVPNSAQVTLNTDPSNDKRPGAYLSFRSLGSKTNLLSIRRVRTA